MSKIPWINIIEIQDKQTVKYFLDLDAGDAEAIVLATELNVDLIIFDEKLGMFHAKHVDLKVIGTIGILIKAKKEGIVKELRPLLNELTEKEVWISEKLQNEILKSVGED